MSLQNPNSNIKIRFLKVGQGDTIVVESWNGTSVDIGIIDCKNEGRDKNPVVEYLKDLDRSGIIVKVKFFILSHPHEDHCSGAVTLLQHLTENNILLERFYSTFYFDPRFQRSPKGSAKLISRIKGARKEMLEKYEKINFRSKGSVVACDTCPRLTPGTEIRCLVPDEDALLKYFKKLGPGLANSNLKNSSAANLLSTVLKIVNDDKYVLLTSDADFSAFSGLLHDLDEEFEGLKLSAAQVPHHGSIKNYCREFWEKIKSQESQAIAVISVGKNDHGHPSRKVLDHLEDNNYNIERTDRPKTTTKKSERAKTRLIEVSSPAAKGDQGIVINLSK
jgi:beta-lactamase superfamily II metal-dependent hydrolase